MLWAPRPASSLVGTLTAPRQQPVSAVPCGSGQHALQHSRRVDLRFSQAGRSRRLPAGRAFAAPSAGLTLHDGRPSTDSWDTFPETPEHSQRRPPERMGCHRPRRTSRPLLRPLRASAHREQLTLMCEHSPAPVWALWILEVTVFTCKVYSCPFRPYLSSSLP